MSTTGPLLPTVAQGDPGGIPLDPLQENTQEEALVPSPSSVVNSPGFSPSKIPFAKLDSSYNNNKCDDDTKLKKLAGCHELSGEAEAKEFDEEKGSRIEESSSLQHERLNIGQKIGPRPPTSGKEKLNPLREWSSNYSDLNWERGNVHPEMFQDEGGGDGPAFVESDEDGSPAFGSTTPPAVRWAESLRYLLEDEIGAKIFKSFLYEELGSIKMLDFWYACNGLRNQTSIEDTNELITLIWKSFFRKNAIKVSTHTYSIINDRISQKNIDSHIFDQAQFEVESEMNHTIYPAFLKSELYLSYLIPTKQEEEDSPSSPNFLPDGCYPYGGSSYLPTLHEDSEYEGNVNKNKLPPKLTSSNLLASVMHRANIERTRSEANAGLYLKGSPSYKQSPYHTGRVSGHAVSLQDSELQSLSSGAHTDDTKSYTDSSVDGISVSLGHSMSRKHQKRQNQRMKENALQNKEPYLISSSITGTYMIPRTMQSHPKQPSPNKHPEEFFRMLSEKLEQYIQEQDSKERLSRTLWKLTHSDEVPDEVRREHAVNALPPNLLVNKLNEKVNLDEHDPCQSILDEHVARIWDSPICSPGSPKPVPISPPHKGSKTLCTRQLPHLSLPQPISPSVVSAHMTKCVMKGGNHHPSVMALSPHPQSLGYPIVPQSVVGIPSHSRAQYSTGQGTPSGHVPYGYQPRNSYHGRRRERGQDVYSTFSSDSGNVADYHDASEHVPPSHLPKSKSMPEYIENHAVGTTSDGGSAAGKRQNSGSRRSCRRPPADLTDSGVSVVSDSGRSIAPSSSSERVVSWLCQSRPFATGGSSSHSVYPTSYDKESRDLQKVRGTRSTHTIAGSTSPGIQRRSGGSSGRRSQCSSSTSGNTCISTHPLLGQDMCAAAGNAGIPCSQLSHTVNCSYQPFELIRDSPLGQSQQYMGGDRKKNSRGGSSSSKSTGQSSCHGDGSGSNGSTLKKQQRSKQAGEAANSSNNTTTTITTTTTSTTNIANQRSGTPHNVASSVPAPCSQISGTVTSVGGSSPDITTIVYSFQDDLVPFIIKVPLRPVTLRKFKQHLPKKGSYRFFFKNFCEDMGMVYEEITDDSETLPLFEGKVFAQIHKDD